MAAKEAYYCPELASHLDYIEARDRERVEAELDRLRLEPSLLVKRLQGRTVEFSSKNKESKIVPCFVDLRGDLLTVKPAIMEPSRLPKGGKKGRKICGFSKSSRLNMMRKLASVSIPFNIFATLTYDDTVLIPASPDDFHKKMKIDFARLRDNLYDNFPGLGVVYKIESEPRKSGLYPGLFVPHVHMIIALGEYDSVTVRDYLLRRWLFHTGTSNPSAFSVTYHKDSWIPLKNKKQVYYYISKYITKVNGDYGFATGRLWGYWGFSFPEENFVPMNLSETKLLHRILRRWVKSQRNKNGGLNLRGRRYLSSTLGKTRCSLFVSGLVCARLMDYILSVQGIPF